MVDHCRARALIGGSLITLDTRRLSLIPSDPEQILTLIESPERFAEVSPFGAAPGLRDGYVSADVAPAWLAALRGSSGPDPWRHGFFVIQRASATAIGSAGFKGPPDGDGTVEIAYGIVPDFRGQGYATEAADALVSFAFARDDVRLVRAHTLPAANASTRVLTKCGFHCLGTVIDPEDGPVWRWERGR